MLVGALEPAPAINQAELAFAQFSAAAELARQNEVSKARRYYEGDQVTFLTPRLRQFLDVGADTLFRLNVCKTVITAATERMTVEGFDCSDVATAKWALALWNEARLDAKQGDIHEGALRDGEYFIIVDWDAAEGRPRFTPHQRFTDPQGARGDGEGCKATYANDDPNQPLLFVSKRWTETLAVHGKNETRQRVTLYFPDRVEKYMHDGKQWAPLKAPGEEWPMPWLDEAGEPLGIAAIHYCNKGMASEIENAIPLQDAMNKTLIDVLGAADMTGFAILFAAGFIPTTDSQPMNASQSNALDLQPGMTVATSQKDGKLTAINAADPTHLLKVLDALLLYLAIATDTPVQRFQMGGQRVRAETLQEEENPLLAKIEERETRFGDAWEDAFDLARRLTNLALARGMESSLWPPEEATVSVAAPASAPPPAAAPFLSAPTAPLPEQKLVTAPAPDGPFDLSQNLTVTWKSLTVRDVKDKVAEATAKKLTGVPQDQIWRDVWDYDEETIQRMLGSPEHQARLSMLRLGLQVSEAKPGAATGGPEAGTTNTSDAGTAPAVSPKYGGT
jgi:hypothetical protein